ncbi:amino acid racemase [candidate division KSB1 bacterium]|nr:amino acid racemase [candidate division KSB1 bacterium]NIR72248.1 amino acid racemase [candidate division KSB1 bacterium]NIS24219.1 amino acid racemase [candidate division KSB1 bacterium]NIT71133.1 amino acid racemase [candidate division KSB1 bacterium]NIU24838.1 amino acid racemase [candidate division KSB1 bacterium]
MRKKTIGVLGGMGPEATVLFFRRLVELTPAERDQDHIPIIVYNNPQTPDRTEAVFGRGESPLLALIKGASILQKAGSDLICIPCNTAHVYFSELQAQIDTPIINLIEVVREAALRTSSRLRKVGILATKGTVRTGLYQKAFEEINIQSLAPEGQDLNELQAAIQHLKRQSKESHTVQRVGETLVEQGIQALILGCTELGLIASELELDVPILDSVEVLAQKAVRVALNQEGL